MRTIIVLAFLIVATYSFGQDLAKNDSLINEMCKTIILTHNLSDSTRILTTYKKHLYPFLANYPQASRKEIGTAIYFRFQRNCKEFNEILARLEPSRSDWEMVHEKPKKSNNKKLCRQFLGHINYTYLEHSGDTVHVKIENGYWVDHFKDGTFSKLKFNWVSDCEFDIEFIESNNETRKNFSKPGDKYRYQILDKKISYFDMSVEISGQETYMKFKIYY